jgi:predicted deacylase
VPERPRELLVGGTPIQAGSSRRIEIPVARLPTRNMLHLPVTVVHGAHKGARIWLNAAVHGDEINGVEIIRRVVEKLNPKRLHGTIVALPVVNVFGFVAESRYLPDRRDLNRSFPGSRGGSLAAQIAHLFLKEVVGPCQVGVDLHTGAQHRTNLPQIRADLEDARTRRLARAFGAPVVLHSKLREGSLRQAATRRGARVLVYEAGESLRFDTEAIRVGVQGILRLMATLKMRSPGRTATRDKPTEIWGSRWVRAPRSGLLHLDVGLGDEVSARQPLGRVVDVLGDQTRPLTSPGEGIVLGLSRNPVVNRGDGILHLGSRRRQKRR